MSDTPDTDAILRHLDRYGVVDKDRAHAARRPRRTPATGRRAVAGYDAVADLHGMKAADAEIRIRETLYRCRKNGNRKLLVIHGQGHHSKTGEGPVLKTLVHRMLEGDLSNLVRGFKAAPYKDGGDGATVVML